MTDLIKAVVLLAVLYALVGPAFQPALSKSSGTRYLLGIIAVFLTLSLL
jgi:hypothetical protein